MTTPAQGAPEAEHALWIAATAAGLLPGPGDGTSEPSPAARPRLLRHGSNAVYALAGGVPGRVAPGGVVARVTRAEPHAERDVRQALDVARWLAAEDFPAVRAVADDELATPQPIIVPGHLVTFWHSVGDDPRHGSTADLGHLLRRFHALRLPATLHPLPMDPVGRIRRQLAGSAALRDADRTLLTARTDELVARCADLDLDLDPALPPGHLHGDATVANVVVDTGGRPVLIDLDLLRVGRREWDLVRTAVYARRLGWHSEAEYRDFCRAYGVDVAARPGFDVLADLCELLQVAWLADAAGSRPALDAELAVRIETLRTGAKRCVWRRI